MTGNIPTNITDMTEQEIQERLAILHQEKENRRKLIQGYESQVNKIAQRILESNTALKNLLKSLTELSTLTGDQKKKILQALEN
jgi:ATP-dependent Zn protease